MPERPGVSEPFALILIGPMGCGKSTVGRLLAQRLDWPFWDADDFHPPANVARMKAGLPLTDDDRWPWLDLLREKMDDHLSGGGRVVMACSALRQSYRDRLGIDQTRVRSVYLRGTPDLLRERVAQRRHRFMPPDLLASQLADFEEPQDGLVMDISFSPESIVEKITAAMSGGHLTGKV